jgi:AcrR family transcriptional regulator
MTDAGRSTGDVDETPAASRGGRPRDPALDEVIIRATRRRLVLDGYSAMTIADIATDAGVSRPTIYRRWAGKLELTIDALDYGFRAQGDTYPNPRLEELSPLEAFTEAVRRVDPCYFNPDAMVLMGNFMAETVRTRELLAVVVERRGACRHRRPHDRHHVLRQLLRRVPACRGGSRTSRRAGGQRTVAGHRRVPRPALPGRGRGLTENGPVGPPPRLRG